MCLLLTILIVTVAGNVREMSFTRFLQESVRSKTMNTSDFEQKHSPSCKDAHKTCLKALKTEFSGPPMIMFISFCRSSARFCKDV